MVRSESSLRGTGLENSVSSRFWKRELSFDPRSRLPGWISDYFSVGIDKTHET